MDFIDLYENEELSKVTAAFTNVESFTRRSFDSANSAKCLQHVAMSDIHPTQLTVGYREVELKRQQIRRTDLSERERFARSRKIPVVTGPSAKFYTLDRHHWLCALAAEGVQTIEVTVVANLRGLEHQPFWRLMEYRGWCHPYDATGARRSAADIPGSIIDLQDDPLRSLASSLRRVAGIPKESSPFSEFRLANYLRRSIPMELVLTEYDRALETAIRIFREQPLTENVVPHVTSNSGMN